MKKILLAAFMVLLLNVNSNAQEKKKKTFNYYSTETFNALNATPEQHKQLKELIAEYTPLIKEITDDTSLTAEEKQAKAKPIYDARGKKYYAILTPEQYKEVMKMRQAVAAENKANGF